MSSVKSDEQTFLSDAERAKGLTGVLHVMDGSGDTRHTWDRNEPASIEIAKKVFADLQQARYLVYSVRSNGARGEVMRSFDPQAEALVAVPQTAGG